MLEELRRDGRDCVYLIRLRLPCSEADAWDLGTSIELEGVAAGRDMLIGFLSILWYTRWHKRTRNVTILILCEKQTRSIGILELFHNKPQNKRVQARDQSTYEVRSSGEPDIVTSYLWLTIDGCSSIARD